MGASLSKSRVSFAVATATLMSIVAASPGVGVPASAATTVTTAAMKAATTEAPINVASFNVRTARSDATTAGERPWRERRVAVIRDILREDVEVLGLQEATQNFQYADRLVDGPNQYLDLRNGLNKAGGHYELTNAEVGVSRSTRILYDTQAVSVVRTGSYTYAHQSDGPHDTRYLVWAVFEHKASKQRFFFGNTHLATGSESLQRAQWQELIDKVNELKGDLPVVVVGDFQRSRLKQPVAEMMNRMHAAGYGDVLGQQPLARDLDNPRPGRLKRAWVNSTNGFKRDVAEFSHETKRYRPGHNADWIFASNHLGVEQWEVVLRMNPRTLRLRGVIPSDHHMVKATINLR